MRRRDMGIGSRRLRAGSLAGGLCVGTAALCAQELPLGTWQVVVARGGRPPIAMALEDAAPARPALMLLAAAGPAISTPAAATPAPGGSDKSVPAAAAPAGAGGNSLADKYCASIADAAKGAWLDGQKKALAEAEKQIEARIAALEAKTAEHKLWIGRREEFARRAQDSVLKIYARMRPDAAAAQLLALDELTAAAILSRLEPKAASLVMAEMQATRAARLSATMAGAAGLAAPVRGEAAKEAKK